MRKLRAGRLALVMSAAALAAAGCGGSSKSKPAAKAPATPNTSAATTTTPSTSSTTPSAAGQITASTPISSPSFRALLIKGEAQAAKGRLTQTELGQLADCAIKKFEAEGVKTAGEVTQHRSQSQQFGAECAKELNLKLH